MAYIAPNTDVKLYANVPLTPEYANTISFDGQGIAGQQVYFETKLKYRLSNFSYQRKTGSISVNLPIEQVITCNYMSYKNASFENKTFYAFIINCEYVSNNVTEIFFEEDVMQTWLFDYTSRECFIVRQHALTDEIGDNCVPEDFELGQYVIPQTVNFNNELVTVIIGGVVYDFSSGAVTVVKNSDADNFGYFQALNYIVCESPKQAGNVIDAIQTAGQSNAILSIAMMPKSPFQSIPGNYTSMNPTHSVGGTVNVNYTNINGFIPLNKKLYTAPYNFFEITNGCGQVLKIEPQYLSNKNVITYDLYYSNEPAPSTSFILRDYKESEYYHDNVVKLTNYPVCGYISDTFKTWYVQNSVAYQYDIARLDKLYNNETKKSIKADAISSVKSVAAGMAGGAIGIAASLGLSGAKFINSGLDLRRSKSMDKYDIDSSYAKSQEIAKVDSINISYTGSSSSDFYFNEAALRLKHIQITAEFAKKIDKFFTVYGYAVNAFGKPQEFGRRNFNYVKTAGSDVIGNIPQYALSAINDIYDNGITFWHNPDAVGDYNIRNDIVGAG